MIGPSTDRRAGLDPPPSFGRARKAAVGASNYISGVSYHPNGLLAGANYLNGQVLTQTLNSRQRPDQLKTAKVGAATAVWLTYAYEVRGKVSSATDTVNAAENRSYSYDANGRLLTASGPWGAGSYTYDALGNVRGWTQGATTAAIGYDAAANRVSTAALTGAASRTFAYDSRGNTTNDGRNAFTYDFANQPVSAGGASYAYDANLKRVKSVAGNTVVYTLYSRVTGGLVYRDQTVVSPKKTDYVTAGGASLRLAGGVPEYTHADALGSPLAATSSTGAVTWRESFTPFGEARLKPAANDNNTGFTGHLADKATGLLYMQARLYDPLVGRFYATDPIGYEDQLNLYAYVANDPVNNTDPTGECANLCTAAIGAGFGALIGGGFELANQLTDDKAGVSLGRVGISAGKGFIAGGIIGGTGCVACGAGAAAALGAVDGAKTAEAEGGNVVAGAFGQAAVDGVSTLAGGKAGQFVGGKIAGAIAETAATVGGATVTQGAINAGTDAAGAAADAFQAGVEAAAPVVSGAVDQVKNMGDNFTPSCSRQEGGC